MFAKEDGWRIEGVEREKEIRLFFSAGVPDKRSRTRTRG